MARSSGVRTASILPLLVTILFLLASLTLYLLRSQIANNFVFIIGYLLTPVGVTFTMAWDLLAQRKGQLDPNFDVRPAYSKIIRMLAFAGYAVGLFHIWELGVLLGQWAVQSGVFG